MGNRPRRAKILSWGYAKITLAQEKQRMKEGLDATPERQPPKLILERDERFAFLASLSSFCSSFATHRRGGLA